MTVMRLFCLMVQYLDLVELDTPTKLRTEMQLIEAWVGS